MARAGIEAELIEQGGEVAAAPAHNGEVYDRSIDVQILRLRRKIERDPSQPRYIHTVRGAGYVFRAAVEKVR